MVGQMKALPPHAVTNRKYTQSCADTTIELNPKIREEQMNQWVHGHPQGNAHPRREKDWPKREERQTQKDQEGMQKEDAKKRRWKHHMREQQTCNRGNGEPQKKKGHPHPTHEPRKNPE